MVQWLRFHASIAGGMGSIPGQGTKIPHATWHSQLKKKKDERELTTDSRSSKKELTQKPNE